MYYFYSKGELKKDPSGYNYKKVAMNIYRELFTTKLWDKIWQKNASGTSITNNNNDVTISTSTTVASSSTTNSATGGNENKVDELNVLNLLNSSNSAITESIFEKLALMEFEASIYSQLSCSKILLFYFQRIVANEIKCIRNKPSRTILVNPVEKKMIAETTSGSSSATTGATDYLTNENLKLMSKKLSLTIADLGN